MSRSSIRNFGERFADSIRQYNDRRIVAMALLGFSSGLPLKLVFATLAYWLVDADIDATTIGIFSLASVPYSLKFAWSPLFDRIRIPLLSARFGLRRSWIAICQLALIVAIAAMAASNPAVDPVTTGLLALIVATISASQDVVIDAWRVETFEDDKQSAAAAASVFGYRMAMLATAAGALHIAAHAGALDFVANAEAASTVPLHLEWRLTYVVMAGLVGVGMVGTALATEPEQGRELLDAAHPLESLRRTFVEPLRSLALRPMWVAVLLLVLTYKLSDALAGAMMGPFLMGIGVEKDVLASVRETWGLVAAIVGVALGSIVVRMVGLVAALGVGSLMMMATNGLFVLQDAVGPRTDVLVMVIGLENLTSGVATAAFVTWLSILCDRRFTATQYAVLTSLSSLSRTVLGAGTGWAAQRYGWSAFFGMTVAANIPALALFAALVFGGHFRRLAADRGGR